MALDLRVRSKLYTGADGGASPVFEEFCLQVPAGEFLVITGPSGCGKTTLLNIAAGLDRRFDGERTVAVSDGREPVIGYVFQDPRLLPWRTVEENLLLVLAASPRRASGAIRERARRWLRQVGLEDVEGYFPRQLSMGMARRVALARAFAVEPDLLLMDEPFVSLDEETAEALRQRVLTIAEPRTSTVLFVTHDLDEAARLGDRIIVLGGRPAQIERDMTLGLSTQQRNDPGVRQRLREHLKGSPGERTATVGREPNGCPP